MKFEKCRYISDRENGNVKFWTRPDGLTDARTDGQTNTDHYIDSHFFM